MRYFSFGFFALTLLSNSSFAEKVQVQIDSSNMTIAEASKSLELSLLSKSMIDCAYSDSIEYVDTRIHFSQPGLLGTGVNGSAIVMLPPNSRATLSAFVKCEN